MCTPEHIAQLATLLTRPWGPRADPLVRYDADPEYDRSRGDADAYSYVFRALWAANALSVATLYRHPDTPEPCPPVPRCSIDPWVWMTTTPDAAVRVLKAVNCYRYQSDNHDGFPRSLAGQWTDALETAAVRSLPGYSEAAWGAPFGP